MTHKIELAPEEYQNIITVCANSVSADDARPSLRYIKLTIKAGRLEAMSCDGYQLARIFLSLAHDFTEEFECYIRPVSCKKPAGEVEISYNDATKETEVHIPTEEGKIVYVFARPFNESIIDADRVIGKANERPYYIGLDAGRMMKACKSLLKQGKSTSKGFFKMSIPEEKNKGVLLESLDGKVQCFVLPVRIDL